MASSPNVLRYDAAPEQSSARRVPNEDYRKAVAQVVGEIQLERNLNDEQLAEKLGCSEGTVANARNKRGNLDAVTMLNLGAKFGGEERLKRILALVSGSPTEEPTAATLLEAIERNTNMLRRLVEKA